MLVRLQADTKGFPAKTSVSCAAPALFGQPVISKSFYSKNNICRLPFTMWKSTIGYLACPLDHGIGSANGISPGLWPRSAFFAGLRHSTIELITPAKGRG